MKKLFIVIAAVTCSAVFYHVAPLVGAAAGTLVVLFVFSQFIALYLAACVVIKHGIPSDDTFEDKFREDYPYRRNRPTGIAYTGRANP